MRAPHARIAAAAATAFLSLTLAPHASAQCLVPDGLDGGPCCATATVVAPRAPNFQQDSLSICWKECDVESIGTTRAVWSSPTPADNCKNYAKRLRLKGAGGVIEWNGRMKFRYSRTWSEIDTAGVERQVWRYLVNGDLRPTSFAGAPPCPVPPCAAANGNKVRYTGYVDYALDCAGGLQEFAWMLTHACDAIDHAPGFPRAGAFHPDRTYTFVGPAAGFVVSSLVPAESGSGMLEAVRRIGRLPGTTDDFCEFEERGQNSLNLTSEFCLCGPNLSPTQFALSKLSISGSCGTTLSTLGGPFLPGFVSQSIGSWTNPTAFPGIERLRWNCGGYSYGDPCAAVVRDEVFFGVTTDGGWPARQLLTVGSLGVALPPMFIDQGNSLKGNLGTTMNRPYRSDHILNLNY